MATADVIVIGGGVNGASTAFRLAELGVRRVVLLERRHLAAEASGKSGALVRMHYTNEAESRLAFASLPVFQHWDKIVGGSCGFQAPGFVQVVAPEYEETLRVNVKAQRRLGVNTRVVSADELRELAPALYTGDLTYAAYEPDSGYADPVATTHGFARRAAELGAEIRTHSEVAAITTDGGRVTGVELVDGERIAASVVVLAAGTLADRLLGPLGYDFGLAPYRSQVAIYRWPPEVTGHPVVIDRILGCWLRPEGQGTLIGDERGSGAEEAVGYEEGLRPGYAAVARETLARRIPAMADSTMRGGWTGVYMLSPDHHPIIDRLPGHDGLFVMAGDSGTSFKTAPAIGQCLAEWIVDGAPRTADLAAFSASRFAEGRLWQDQHAYGERHRRATVAR